MVDVDMYAGEYASEHDFRDFRYPYHREDKQDSKCDTEETDSDSE